MRGRLTWGRAVRPGIAAVAALAVGAAGVVGVVPTTAAADVGDVAPLSVPGMAVSLAQAGELRLWGDNSGGQSAVPASLADVAVSQVVFPLKAGVALTADGRVVGWGANPERLERVPSEVAAAKVSQIATQGLYVGAVTSAGQVLVWGKKRSTPTPLDIPAGLSGVKQLAMTELAGAALKADGSVVAWGTPSHGQNVVPAGLEATTVVADNSRFYALTKQGTVKVWGSPILDALPPSLLQPGNVKAIAASAVGAVALLADDTFVQFGSSGGQPPAEIAGAEALLLANSTGAQEFAIVDRDRAIHYWSGSAREGGVPAELNGRALVQVTLASAEVGQITGGALITKFLRAELPQVTGTATVGSVLTGVPGTFSAVPDSVTSQWLVDGSPAGTGAQLSVTAAMVGKSITYRSTATKAGETAITTTSAAVPVTAPVQPPVPVVKVSSNTKVAKVTVAKKAKSVTVAGKVTATKSPAGKATVTIKKGKKTILAKSVGVSSAGAVKLTVKKFAQLVAKKLKAKGKKAKTAYRGKYQVTISYAGNALVKPSAGSGKFTIKK